MRATCARCRRPEPTCYCQDLTPVPTRTRVVFLQHPRERKVAIGTARLAHLGLSNSELHVGVDFAQSERVSGLAADGSGEVALLFPAEGAQDPTRLARQPTTLVVIDGTWPQAKKVFKLNPALHALPRVGLRPRRPSNYRIRKEPADHCLSTVEAVAEVLSHLEGDEERFSGLLQAFDRMVDFQLEHSSVRAGPARRKRRRVRSNRQWAPSGVERHWESLVLVHGEANAPAFTAAQRFTPELVHLVAVRPATGERMELLLAPRHPLGDHIPHYLDLPEGELLGGASAGDALSSWQRFAGASPVLGVWGSFTLELLSTLGDGPRESVDLRQAAIRRLQGLKPGGVERAASLLQGAPATAVERGRCGRRLAALERVMEGLRA